MKRIIQRRTATHLMECLQRRVNNPEELTPKGRSMNTSSLLKREHEFNATDTAEDFIKLYKFGWKKGRDTLKNNMVDMVQKNKLVLDTAVKGFGVSVPDYLAGNPENMFSMEYSNHKCVDIVVPVGANGGTDSATLLAYVAAVMTVLQSIVNSGYKASLKIVSYTNYYERLGVMYLTDIVAAGDIIDLDKVACCFHPDFYRRAEFAAEEVNPEACEIVAGTGYGSAEQWGKAAMLKLAPDLKQDTLYFPAMDTQSGGNKRVLADAIVEVKKILNPTKSA